jgi:hypothetical protein
MGYNKSGSIDKSVYSQTKLTCSFFEFAVIFLLLFSLSCTWIQYNNEASSSSSSSSSSVQAQAKILSNSLTDSSGFIKIAAHAISSDSNSSYVPFTSNFTLPPRIVMVYNGTQHPGVLISYKFRHEYTFGQLDIPAKKVTALLPSDAVNIKKAHLFFFAKGNPQIVPPASLSIDVYTSQGKAVTVLNTTKSASTTIPLNLPEGKYILLTTATWIPGSEDVTGYAIFSYMINIVPS